MFKLLFTSLKNAKSIVDIFDENQKKYMPSLVLAEEVLREPSHLSSAERELIAAFTSRLNKCDYCADSHTAFAKEQGMPI
jgi:AhpD family alkylhydroperoxidase